MPVSNDPSSFAQTRFVAGGATSAATDAGKRVSTGSGPKKQLGPPSSAQAAAAVMPPPGGPKPPMPKMQGPPKKPQFSANNPMMSVQPPPVPHPGVSPPYPDARSPAPTLLPNGMPLMPIPKGYPLGSQLHVPPSFAPSALPAQGMTGLLRR